MRKSGHVLGAYVTDNMGSILSFLMRFCGTICFAFIVMGLKESVSKICNGVYVRVHFSALPFEVD